MGKGHKPTGRKYWEEYIELDCYLKGEKIIVINIGADDPTLLGLPKALEFAIKVARRKKFNTLVEIENDIRLYGQNNLAERKFLFKK